MYPSSVPYDYVEEEDEGAVAVAKHVTDVTWGGRLDVFNLPSEAGARTNKVRAGRMLCVDWSFDQDIFTCPRDSRLQEDPKHGVFEAFVGEGYRANDGQCQGFRWRVWSAGPLRRWRVWSARPRSGRAARRSTS